ncbi:hypothetical protein ACQKND_17910 [Viridibacillus arvi]|uniref:hypothetical protein n=1 Tax=Viridibacillus arvi TaxID=263475 RepID=UPI003D043CDD
MINVNKKNHSKTFIISKFILIDTKPVSPRSHTIVNALLQQVIKKWIITQIVF